MKRSLLKLDTLKHFGFVLIIVLFIGYNFFYIGNYAAYPWYHEVVNDSDGTYSSQAVSILNGNETEYMHHPGATVCALHGFGYQTLGLFSESHSKLTKLNQVRDLNEAYQVLDTATRTSRIFSLLALIIFSVVFYAVAFQITRHALLSALVTFFIFTSTALLHHSHVVRPELLNILFFFMALFLTIKVLKNSSFYTKLDYIAIMFIGIFIGYSIFAKIQILPVLALFFGCLVFYLFRFFKIQKEALLKTAILSFFISLGNLILMPWWATKKPSLLTPEYLKNPNVTFVINDVEYGAYGSAPENITSPVFAILFALMLITFICFYFFKKNAQNKFFTRLVPSTLFLNLIALGFILSIYLVYLPVFDSANYFKNTNHLFYSLVSNVFYGNGFLMNDKFTFSSALDEIIRVHSIQIQSFSFNLFYVSAFIATISIAQFFIRKGSNGYLFLLLTLFFATGFLMDFTSMLRAPYMMNQYTIYSRVFYGMSLVIWIYVQFIEFPFFSKKVKFICLYLIVGLLILNVIFVSNKFYKSPHADGISTFKEDKINEEIYNTKAYVAPFWKTVDKAMLQGQTRSIKNLKDNLISYFDQRKSEKTTQLIKIENRAFKKGEVLKYNIHYGLINAGDAILKVKTDTVNIGKRDIWLISLLLKSNSKFDMFFKVRDYFESYIDQEAIVPWVFIRRCQEGNTKIDRSTFFDRYNNKVISDKGIHESTTPANIQDVISAFYYIRCLDFSNGNFGKEDSLTTFFDDELFNFRFKFLGKDVITTPLGSFSCLKFCPILSSNELFNNEEDILLWITDDENKVLIRGQVNIPVGSIKMDLTHYSGLANEFSIIQENKK
ncbi:MAG: DUF3108 domain-containing protein [Bacteroidota bacterium]|nr:DUF3108 domain-containing protein [Bacteroidota bacterium]